METSNLQGTSSRNLPDLPSTDMLVNITAGTILFLSGVIHIRNITSTLKTVLGSYLLFKGLTAYSNAGSKTENTSSNAEPEQLLSEADTLIMVTE